MKQDFEKVKYYLDLAASHYGYGSYDIFSNSDLYEKEEKAEKIMRLAELIKKEVHLSETELINRISKNDGFSQFWHTLNPSNGHCSGIIVFFILVGLMFKMCSR